MKRAGGFDEDEPKKRRSKWDIAPPEKAGLDVGAPPPGLPTDSAPGQLRDSLAAAALAAAAAMTAGQGQPRSCGAPPPSMPSMPIHTHEAQLMYPKSVVGKIIGPAGATIRSLREATGARISVSRDVVDGTQNRAVQIQGTPEQVRAASEAVTKLMEGEAGPSGVAGGVERSNVHSREQARFVIGPRGSTIKALRDQSGAHIRVADQCDVNGQQTITYTGTEEQVQAAIAMVHGVLAGMPEGGGVGAAGGLWATRAPETTITETVPKEQAGKLIGKGGAVIKGMRERSGAQIRLSQEPDAAGMREVTIIGTEEQVQAARLMVAEQLAASDNGPPRDTPQHNPYAPPPVYAPPPMIGGYGYAPPPGMPQMPPPGMPQMPPPPPGAPPLPYNPYAPQMMPPPMPGYGSALGYGAPTCAQPANPAPGVASSAPPVPGLPPPPGYADAPPPPPPP